MYVYGVDFFLRGLTEFVIAQKLGHSPLHFAMEYHFTELGAWLVKPDGGGANDQVYNKYGLGPYDGLVPQ